MTDEETRAHVAGAASAAAAEVAGPPAVTPDLTGAAFFDVDNTMMMGASLFWFARGLAARKYFTTRDMAGFIWQQAKFRIAGTESSADDMHTIRENGLAFVAGRPVAEIVQASEEIYDELMADRIWAGTRSLAQQHLDAGQRVWLVTATPVELASIIAHRLGLTGALGTVAEVVDGKYTGRLVGELMHGPAKAEAVLALAEREGLDLTRCTAYSDSANDLPMLSLTGTRGRGQPGHRAAGGRPLAGLDDPRLPDRPEGRQDRRAHGRGRRAVRRARRRRAGPAEAQQVPLVRGPPGLAFVATSAHTAASYEKTLRRCRSSW